MGEVIFLKQRAAAGTAREAESSTVRSMDDLAPIAPWRRREFDAQLRVIIGVASAAQTSVRAFAEGIDDDGCRASAS